MSTSKLQDRLLEDVVILREQRNPRRPARNRSRPTIPRANARAVDRSRHAPRRSDRTPRPSLQHRVEQFLFYQSELLDQKQWAAYIELFGPAGVYWMPVTPDQTEWLDSPSIFAEDRHMMEIRMGRVQHPNAWSQAPNGERVTSSVCGARVGR